jgi:NADH:ubiquinone oxidoreductase subunit C
MTEFIMSFYKAYLILKSILTTKCYFVELCKKNKYCLFVSSKQLYNVVLHIRFSSYFYLPALIDITAFDTFLNKTAVVYIFTAKNSIKCQIFTLYDANLLSIDDLFKNACWYEREVREMFNVNFKNSSDCRNLLLPYAY